MAKLNWLNKAIKTQHRRFQNDYAGQMGVRHRAWQAAQEAEERELMAEALEGQERLEKTIKADMLLNSNQLTPEHFQRAKEMVNDPNYMDDMLDLLNQDNKL